MYTKKTTALKVLCIVMFVLSVCLVVKIMSIEKKCKALNERYSLSSFQRDVNILMGDTVEYDKCNIDYTTNRLGGREYLLYSFIMADKYNNKFASQQFTDILINHSDIVIDSVLTYFLTKYLIFAATDDNPQNSMSKATAAFQLSQWYNGKNKYLIPNDSICAYYDSVGKNVL